MDTKIISDFPIEESDEYEFKSSAITSNEVKKKLPAAASALANSGGGYFIIGLDDNGIADGGWETKIGNQSVPDWIDKVIHLVEPAPKYEIFLIDDVTGRGRIDTDKAIYAIYISPSTAAPHMAPDRKYYIRAGAHTVPARAFMVEALWAKRGTSSPILVHHVRTKPDQPAVVQLGVIAITDVPALNVQIRLSNCGTALQEDMDRSPLSIKIVDRLNPFYFDVAYEDEIEADLPSESRIEIDFEDIASNRYSNAHTIDVAEALAPFSLSESPPSAFGSVGPRRTSRR